MILIQLDAIVDSLNCITTYYQYSFMKYFKYYISVQETYTAAKEKCIKWLADYSEHFAA